MFNYITIFIFAKIFHYIGNNDFYEKGMLFAAIDVITSLAVLHFTPLGLVGIVGLNVFFYLLIFVRNLVSKKPPRSGSGF